MGQARSLVFDLRQPVDSQDLASTTTLFAEEVGGLSEVKVEVRVRGTHRLLKPQVHDEGAKDRERVHLERFSPRARATN